MLDPPSGERAQFRRKQVPLSRPGLVDPLHASEPQLRSLSSAKTGSQQTPHDRGIQHEIDVASIVLGIECVQDGAVLQVVVIELHQDQVRCQTFSVHQQTTDVVGEAAAVDTQRDDLDSCRTFTLYAIVESLKLSMIRVIEPDAVSPGERITDDDDPKRVRGTRTRELRHPETVRVLTTLSARRRSVWRELRVAVGDSERHEPHTRGVNRATMQPTVPRRGFGSPRDGGAKGPDRRVNSRSRIEGNEAKPDLQ